MDEGQIVALPSLVARAVENLICGHRRDRKILFTNQPNGWKQKLEKVNGRILSFVVDLKQGALATAHYLKRSVAMQDGQLQFLGKGLGFEILRIAFKLHEGETGPAGPGVYTLYSKNFAAREICCVSTSASHSGFDLLREHYAGQCGQPQLPTHNVL